MFCIREGKKNDLICSVTKLQTIVGDEKNFKPCLRMESARQIDVKNKRISDKLTLSCTKN